MSTFIPLDQARAKFAEEREKQRAEYAKNNRLNAGTGLEGRIIKVASEVSRKGNDMYTATFKCDGNDGKKTEIKKYYSKMHDMALDEFYSLINLAGFDLKKIDSQDKFDQIIDCFEENLPRIKFNCVHQKDPSTNNNYEITQCENIAPKELALVVVADEKKVEDVEEEKELGSKKKTSTTIQYTAADVEKFEDKDECIEVAEELGLVLKGKTKTSMKKEIIDFLNGATEEVEEEEDDLFPDKD